MNNFTDTEYMAQEFASRPDTMVDLAETIARLYHSGQTDMAGKPYAKHCERVARNLSRAGFISPTVQAVAWLHDVVEDTPVTLEMLRRWGFSEAVIQGVDAMTQRVDQDGVREDLEVYWGRVKANKIAHAVKVHGDIPDNNDPERQSYLSEAKQNKLKAKYARALEFLGDVFPDETICRRCGDDTDPSWYCSENYCSDCCMEMDDGR